MNSALMTQAEYAAHRGVLKSAVSNWKAKGLLVMAPDPADRGKLKVDVAQTDAKLASRVDPLRGRPRTAESAPAVPDASAAEPSLPLVNSVDREISDVRLELLREQRDGQRMKNLTGSRELLPAIESERMLAEAVRTIFARMGAMHRNLAERLASATEPRAVVAILAEATDTLRTNLANRIDAGDDADDDPDDQEGGDQPAEAEEVSE